MREYFNGIYRDVSSTVIEQARNATDESCNTPTELPNLTEFDRLEAQVTYTAMMTDTLLVEEE